MAAYLFKRTMVKVASAGWSLRWVCLPCARQQLDQREMQFVQRGASITRHTLIQDETWVLVFANQSCDECGQ